MFSSDRAHLSAVVHVSVVGWCSFPGTAWRRMSGCPLHGAIGTSGSWVACHTTVGTRAATSPIVNPQGRAIRRTSSTWPGFRRPTAAKVVRNTDRGNLWPICMKKRTAAGSPTCGGFIGAHDDSRPTPTTSGRPRDPAANAYGPPPDQPITTSDAKPLARASSTAAPATSQRVASG